VQVEARREQTAGPSQGKRRKAQSEHELGLWTAAAAARLLLRKSRDESVEMSEIVVLQANVDVLNSMGFPDSISRWALSQTDSLEDAVSLASARFDAQGGDEGGIGGGGKKSGRVGEGGEGEGEEEEDEEDFRPMKMTLVVRMDLAMSAGKVAAQCVHAALGAYRAAMVAIPAKVVEWEEQGEPVITLQVPSDAEIESLSVQAEALGLPCFAVHDAGRTEVAAGSRTVLAIGPGYNEEIDVLTKKLKLYR